MAQEGGGMTVSKLVVIIMALLLLVLIAVGAYNGWLVNGIQKMGSQMDKILIFFNQKGETTDGELCLDKIDITIKNKIKGSLEICPNQCELTLNEKIGTSSRFKIDTTGTYKYLEATGVGESNIEGAESALKEGWNLIEKTNPEEIQKEVEASENFNILLNTLENFLKEINPETIEEFENVCNSNEECPTGYYCDEKTNINPSYCQNTYFNIETSGGLSSYYPLLSNDIEKPFEKYPYHKWYLYIENNKQNSAYLDEFGRLWYSLNVVGHVTEENKIKFISEYEDYFDSYQKEWIRNHKYLEECILEIRPTTFKKYIEKVNLNLQNQEGKIICNKEYYCNSDGDDCECPIAVRIIKSRSSEKIVCYNNYCPKKINNFEKVKTCQKIKENIEQESILNKIFSQNDIYYIFVNNYNHNPQALERYLYGTLFKKEGEIWYKNVLYRDEKDRKWDDLKNKKIYEMALEISRLSTGGVLTGGKIYSPESSVTIGRLTGSLNSPQKIQDGIYFDIVNDYNIEEFYDSLYSNIIQNEKEKRIIDQLFKDYISKQEKKLEIFEYNDERKILTINNKYGISKDINIDVLGINSQYLKMFELKNGFWEEIDIEDKSYYITDSQINELKEQKENTNSIIDYLNERCW